MGAGYAFRSQADGRNHGAGAQVFLDVPRPGPFGFSFEEVMLNPQPLPPKELQRQIGGYLLMLAGATSLKDVGQELETIGTGLIR